MSRANYEKRRAGGRHLRIYVLHPTYMIGYRKGAKWSETCSSFSQLNPDLWENNERDNSTC